MWYGRFIHNPCNAHLSSIFVPSASQSRTEQESIMQSLDQHESQATLSWPNREQSPINEFSVEGYFSCAFPTLFPAGAADFLAPRVHTVTIDEFF